MDENQLISIIVPIYNVEKYLDECIESIVSQTYTNLEILLINDGSEDCSEEICLKWTKADKRIIYVYKRNETLGPTRNLGIRMARGKYIAFIDPDDWIDSMFIEKMYHCALADDKDFVRCNYYRITETGRFLFNNNEYYPFDDSNIHKMIGSTQAVTIPAGLYKRDLWIDNDIKMPAGPHQDLAIMGLLFIYAKRIGVCSEGLYFYREKRKGNITLQTSGTGSVLTALKHLVKEYKDRNLFKEYRKELQLVCIDKCNTSIKGFKQEKNDILKQEYADNIKIFLKQELYIEEAFLGKRMAALGGYDLQRVFSGIYFSENIDHYKYQHSSVVSFMSNAVRILNDKAETYREKMVEADCGKRLKKLLQNKKLDYVFVDFMEERYDILDFGDQCYLTYSDALKEINISLDNVRIIGRDSKECQRKWEESCDQFIELLQKSVEPKNVFLVRFFLAEGYGGYGKEREYKNLDRIRRINRILQDYYNYFAGNFKGINVIEVDQKYCYTDEGVKYGCHPWHLNLNAQFNVRNKIIEILKV